MSTPIVARLLAAVAMVLAVAAVLASMSAVPALGWDETAGPPFNLPSDMNTYCYEPCHTETIMSSITKGPHGNYTTASSKCDTCHTVHVASSGGIKLLPAATIKAVCFTCHDGTAGRGVYGAIAARGVAVGASHDIESTNIVPGGSPTTGGSATGVFEGPGDTLTCTDCHSAHGSNVVAAFRGERRRNLVGTTYLTSKLLRQQPTSADSPTAVYGSDWCAGCHKGRIYGLAGVHNHPVETAATAAPGTAYNYSNVPVLNSDDPTGITVLGGLVTTGGSPTNRGFLMPYPRTALQTGHFPLCQQCHEDTRSAGELVSGGTQGDAVPTVITAEDGTVPTDNPRFQNFPHETVNGSMLVETQDDLCLNCHPAAALP